MRVAVISDTHHNTNRANEVLDLIAPFDVLIHAGDGVGDLATLAGAGEFQTVGVTGNEDTGGDYPPETTLDLSGLLCHVTHGHQFDLNPYAPRDIWKKNMDDLAHRGNALGARLIIFGHTHRPHLSERSGVVLLNPGDLYPLAPHSHAGLILIGQESFEVSVTRCDRDDRCEVVLSGSFQIPKEARTK
ncbi:MAG: YfcE family phosphodiesterase [Deltaproteobacteria bacterium]|nr:YfcE family phosphodiesterase [Candidatus Zymogenaceae bacterium]